MTTAPEQRAQGRAQRAATLSLIAVTAGWGLSFIVIKDAVGQGSAANFLAFRFALAAVALFGLRPGASFHLTRAQALRAGVLYGTA
jgi:drug/metabolite transporter (DMT)-like permease